MVMVPDLRSRFIYWRETPSVFFLFSPVSASKTSGCTQIGVCEEVCHMGALPHIFRFRAEEA